MTSKKMIKYLLFIMISFTATWTFAALTDYSGQTESVAADDQASVTGTDGKNCCNEYSGDKNSQTRSQEDIDREIAIAFGTPDKPKTPVGSKGRQ